jgi:hypothetical protein
LRSNVATSAAFVPMKISKQSCQQGLADAGRGDAIMVMELRNDITGPDAVARSAHSRKG